MSVREAVDRAMRNRRVDRREFAAIHEELINNLSLTEMQALAASDPDAPVYLIRPEDREVLGEARFRNESERRDFYVGYLTLARQRLMTEIVRSIRDVPEAERASTFRCREADAEISCFREADGIVALWASHGEGESAVVNSLLRFFGRALPRGGFVGLSSVAGGDLTGVQLLDGVFFTLDSVGEAALPAETQLSVSVLRGLVRTQVPDLP